MPIDYSEKILEKSMENSEKVDLIANKICRKIEQTKMKAIKEFQPYIAPKKNVDDLLEFLEQFMDSHEKIEKHRNMLISSLGESLEITNLDVLIENNVIESLNVIDEEVKKNEEHLNIKIVSQLLKEATRIINTIIDKTQPVYFQSLRESDEEKIKKVSDFLISFTDKKEFLAKYSSVMYNKMSFDDVKKDREVLLKRTEDLDGMFVELNNYNIKILGRVNAQSINAGLNKILIINLKKVISDILLVIEKEENLGDVSFLIILNSYLNHKSGNVVEEVEELYIFKNEINKILCNIFLSFFEKVQKLTKPNKFCDIEKLTLDLSRSLDTMVEHKEISKVFLKHFGAFFKIQTLEEFLTKASYHIIEKVIGLSLTLDDMRSHIYLLNNIFTLQKYISQIEGKDVKDYIKEKSDGVVDIWIRELKKRNDGRLTEFIDTNLLALRSYYLPNTIKNMIIPQIKKNIWEEIARKGYNGDESSLNDNINDLFSAK